MALHTYRGFRFVPFRNAGLDFVPIPPSSTVFAPILTRFSRSVVSDQCRMLLGMVGLRRNFAKL